MGISIWRSLVFFMAVGAFGLFLFPSQRELGKVYAEAGIFDTARFYLEKQYHSDPGDLANTLRYLMSLQDHGESRLFERVADRTSAMFPDSIRLKTFLGGYYEGDLQMDKAAVCWDGVVRLDPTDQDALWKVIAYYQYTKKYDALIGLYEHLIQKGFASIEMYYALGRLYSLRRDAGKALTTYTRLLEEHPHEEIARVRLAETYEFIGEKRKAALLYRELTKLRPDDSTIWDKAANGFLSTGDHGKLNEVIREFSLLFPNSPRMVTMLTDYYQRHGKDAKMIVILESLLTGEDDNPYVIKALGEIYYDRGDHDRSRKMIERYNAETGGDYKSHHILGDILTAMGDADGGRREYEKALELLRRDRQ